MKLKFTFPRKLTLYQMFVLVFLFVIFFVGIISIYKLFFSKPTYIYAKVKIGQGLWWVSSQKPSIWFINILKKGDTEKGLTGSSVAEIQNIRYYPWWGSSQYDIYLDVKLKVSVNRKTGTYSFKRATIGIGAPIDFEFPSSQFSGTIINMSTKPIKYNYVKKLVTLTKRNAYPWEFEAIQPGDSLFDGQEKVFEILNKESIDTNSLDADLYGNYNPETMEGRKYIKVKANIKVQAINNKLVFGEDQIISRGKGLNVSTSHFTFNDYTIAQIE